MADQRHTHHTLRMNRAPVLTLWAAVVAAACAQDPTASEVCRAAPRGR